MFKFIKDAKSFSQSIKSRVLHHSNLLFALTFSVATPLFSQGQPCLDNTIGVSAVQSNHLCSGSTRIETATSQPGVRYYLRNNANDTIVSGPLYGTGGPLSFQTGEINTTTTYNVYGEKPSGGLQFDGVNDYVNIPGLTNLSGNALTIEYWFKGTSVQSAVRYQADASNYIVSGWSNTHILSNDGGAGNGVNIGAAVTNGQWHHVAMTWQINTANGFKSYLDGVLIDQRNSSFIPITNQAYNLLLGSVLGTNEFTNGTLDEVRIWNVARTQAQIQASMNTCLSGPMPGLLAYYKFENGPGSSVITDASGNNYTGTMNNMNSTTSWVLGTFNCWSCSLEMNTLTTVTIQTLQDLPLVATNNTFCGTNSGTTITIPSSETGVQYYLRNELNDTIVDGPLIGNGSALSFNTGPINQTTSYNVFAKKSTNPTSSALYFDAVNDRVALGGPADLNLNSTTPFTIETWCNWTGSNYGTLISKYSGASGYYLRLVGNTIHFLMRDESGTVISVANTQGFPTTNSWHHFAVSYDGSMTSSGVRIYLDGNPIIIDSDVSNGTLQPFNNTAITYLGHRPSAIYFSGAIGETRFWNTVRSAAQIASNYNSCLSGSEAGLMAYYNFGDGSGSSILRDLSPASIDGTLTNMNNSTAWTNGPYSCSAVICEQEMSDIETVVVSPNSFHTDTITACGSYEWNGTTYTTSGSYTDTLSSVAGCDSIIHLDLTILTIPQEQVWAYQEQLCPGNSGTTINTGNSASSVVYSLYDAIADTLVYGPVNGGPAFSLSFYTGPVNSTMTYTVIGEHFTKVNGNAVAFDGVDDYLQQVGPWSYFPQYAQFFEASVYLNSYGNGSTIMRIGEYAQFYIDSIGRLHWAADGGNWGGVYDYYDSLGALVPLNEWVNIACSYDIYWNATLYINGVPQAANTLDYHPFSSSFNNFTIGGAPAGAARGWTLDGMIDELAVYNSSGYSSITDLSCIDPSNPNLLMYYNFEEGAGNLVQDTINGNTTLAMQNMNVSTAWQSGLQCEKCTTEMGNQVTLTVQQPTSTTTVIECGSYNWNGSTYTTSGTYTWNGTSAAGCDSIATLNLTILNPTSSTTIVTECDSYHWNGSTYTTSGTYTWNGTNAAGCDSIATLNLTINNSTLSNTTVSACYFYDWNGTTYTTSGVYNWSGTNVAGCDSIATLNLTINHFTEDTINQVACTSFTLNGQTYTVSGSYAQTLTSAAGCDSILYINLIIKHPTTSTSSISQCSSYTWNGTTYTSSGTYTWNGTNAAGCDSTATLNLTILTPTTSSTTVSECVSYNWNGTTYTTSGTYTWNGTNAAGCDSTATLNLTILNPTTSTTIVSECISYNWNGTTYTTSGTYTWNGTNAEGCDSTATLNLTILNPTTSTTTVSECISYNWNGTTYTTSGTYTWSGTNAEGCDSTAMLNLTILNPTTSTTTVSECISYNWNGSTYTTSGTYTWSGTNAAGCDSTATLNLTINTVDATVTDNSPTLTANLAGATYQWIDCDNNNAPIAGATSQSFTATANGNYAVIVTNANCSDTSSCINVDNVGVSEIGLENTLILYPNPTTGVLNLLSDNELTQTEVRVMNALGQEVSKEMFSNASHIELFIEGVTGVYFVEVTSEGKKAIFKVIKE